MKCFVRADQRENGLLLTKLHLYQIGPHRTHALAGLVNWRDLGTDEERRAAVQAMKSPGEIVQVKAAPHTGRYGPTQSTLIRALIGSPSDLEMPKATPSVVEPTVRYPQPCARRPARRPSAGLMKEYQLGSADVGMKEPEVSHLGTILARAIPFQLPTPRYVAGAFIG